MTLVGATHLEAAGIRARMDRGWIEAGIEAVDRDRNELVADLPSGSVATGGFVSVVNDVRSSTYRVEGVREEGGRTILRLDGAPRIGEGVATGFGEGEVETSTLFPLAYLHGTGYRYYHGARMTDVSGTREFRVADVRRPTPDSPFRVYLDPDRHPRAPAKELRRAFRVGKGETVFHLWDFGAGDRVRLPATAVVTFGEGAPRILAGLPVALSGTDPAQSS
jgi:hypothetical protein